MTCRSRTNVMKTGYIYLITNKVNGKQYVGQTTMTIRERWRLHKSNSSGNLKMPVCKAIKKYGANNFVIKTLETLQAETKQDLVDQLNESEIKYIAQFQTFGNGYNATSGGGGTLNKPVTEQTKQLIRETKIGEKNPMYGTTWSPERREQMKILTSGPNNHNYGKTTSPETKMKLSQKLLGRVVSTETRQLISQSMKGRKKSKATIEKMREARQRQGKRGPYERKKIGAPHTEETKRKMSTSQQLRRQREKEAKAATEAAERDTLLSMSSTCSHASSSASTTCDCGLVLQAENNKTSPKPKPKQKICVCKVCEDCVNRETLRRETISKGLIKYNQENPRPFIPRGRSEPPVNMKEKLCTKCQKMLSVENFRPKDDAADRLQPYCNDCMKEYKRLYRAKLKSSGQAYACTHCDKVFTRKDSLTRHIKEKH